MLRVLSDALGLGCAIRSESLMTSGSQVGSRRLLAGLKVVGNQIAARASHHTAAMARIILRLGSVAFFRLVYQVPCSGLPRHLNTARVAVPLQRTISSATLASHACSQSRQSLRDSFGSPQPFLMCEQFLIGKSNCQAIIFMI